jgi:hypothetical protein
MVLQKKELSGGRWFLQGSARSPKLSGNIVVPNYALTALLQNKVVADPLYR